MERQPRSDPVMHTVSPDCGVYADELGSHNLHQPSAVTETTLQNTGQYVYDERVQKWKTRSQADARIYRTAPQQTI